MPYSKIKQVLIGIKTKIDSSGTQIGPRSLKWRSYYDMAVRTFTTLAALISLFYFYGHDTKRGFTLHHKSVLCRLDVGCVNSWTDLNFTCTHFFKEIFGFKILDWSWLSCSLFMVIIISFWITFLVLSATFNRSSIHQATCFQPSILKDILIFDSILRKTN